MNNEYIDITIKKPVYGTFVYVRDIYIEQAIREGKKLKVSIPQGVAITEPEWWKQGQKLEKVFRIPDKPMILYGRHLPLNCQEITKVSSKQQNLF